MMPSRLIYLAELAALLMLGGCASRVNNPQKPAEKDTKQMIAIPTIDFSDQLKLLESEDASSTDNQIVSALGDGSRRISGVISAINAFSHAVNENPVALDEVFVRQLNNISITGTVTNVTNGDMVKRGVFCHEDKVIFEMSWSENGSHIVATRDLNIVGLPQDTELQVEAIEKLVMGEFKNGPEPTMGVKTYGDLEQPDPFIDGSVVEVSSAQATAQADGRVVWKIAEQKGAELPTSDFEPQVFASGSIETNGDRRSVGYHKGIEYCEPEKPFNPTVVSEEYSDWCAGLIRLDGALIPTVKLGPGLAELKEQLKDVGYEDPAELQVVEFAKDLQCPN